MDNATNVAIFLLFKLLTTARAPEKYLNSRYHVPGLNRNITTGTFGFNTVDGLIVAVQSQHTGAATKDCIVLWLLHVFSYGGMYFCECIALVT